MGVAESAASMVCHRIRVRGQVQGVGFRPHVWRLARELDLTGWVRNDSEGVEIEVQGPRAAVDSLVERLRRDPPPLSRVNSIEVHDSPLTDSTRDFVIAASAAGRADTAVTPDTTVCSDCLRELFNPADRRWRHAFINCTNCGPRYTITRGLPYDRPQTAMAAFAMCGPCRHEYASPEDRRFHAQPNACPDCGPRLRLTDLSGQLIDHELDPIAATIARLRRGEIVAIKGVGGFHLACDARQAAAVSRLRERKQRDEKPFALMLANAASVAGFAQADDAERLALESAERPIVLLRKLDVCDVALPGVAPALSEIGVMLPSAPLHFLLFHEAIGRPAGTEWLDAPQPLALVMTSANPGGEPIVRDDDEALTRLSGIADAVLSHDRAIVTRCDDSVLRVFPGARRFMRRARGFTPRSIRLPRAGRPVLALGAMLKATICLTRGDQGFVSQHIGDLDNAATVRALEETIERLIDLMQITPTRVACDRHPDFAGSLVAARWAAERGLPLIAVQHHHAHIAAVAAEHGLQGPVLGLALDGYGMGENGAAWGGEWLVVDGASMRRIGHLAPLALPGGDRAAVSPWRMAAAALHAIGRGAEIAGRFATEPAAGGVALLLERGLHAPPTSSGGRWFDAAAGLLGVALKTSYEGQAAMQLEALASRHGPVAPLAGGWRFSDLASRAPAGGAEAAFVLDAKPLWAQLADETDAARGAALFHATLAEGLAAATISAAGNLGLDRIVLGGGCWLNRLLARAVEQHLRKAGLHVWQAADLPPGDGGLSLGQAWVAMQSEE